MVDEGSILLRNVGSKAETAYSSNVQKGFVVWFSKLYSSLFARSGSVA